MLHEPKDDSFQKVFPFFLEPHLLPKADSELGPTLGILMDTLASGFTAQQFLDIANHFFASADFEKAQLFYERAYERGLRETRFELVYESILGGIRLCSEMQDQQKSLTWRNRIRIWKENFATEELQLAKEHYILGITAGHDRAYNESLSHFRTALRLGRSADFNFRARTFLSMARVYINLERIPFAERQLTRLFHLRELNQHRELKGLILLYLGLIAERRRAYEESIELIHQSRHYFVRSLHWYYSLYTELSLARLARLKGDEKSAIWHLTAVNDASLAGGLGILRAECTREHERLLEETYDLTIDLSQAAIRLKNGEFISLRGQHLLFRLLKVLGEAHVGQTSGASHPITKPPNSTTGYPTSKTTPDGMSISKSEIIRKVWGQKYQSSRHDNRLYYNINRLRKIIEPNAHRPEILIHAHDGYTLAPELKVRLITNSKKSSKDTNSNWSPKP